MEEGYRNSSTLDVNYKQTLRDYLYRSNNTYNTYKVRKYKYIGHTDVNSGNPKQELFPSKRRVKKANYNPV